MYGFRDSGKGSSCQNIVKKILPQNANKESPRMTGPMYTRLESAGMQAHRIRPTTKPVMSNTLRIILERHRDLGGAGFISITSMLRVGYDGNTGGGGAADDGGAGTNVAYGFGDSGIVSYCASVLSIPSANSDFGASIVLAFFLKNFPLSFPRLPPPSLSFFSFFSSAFVSAGWSWCSDPVDC